MSCWPTDYLVRRAWCGGAVVVALATTAMGCGGVQPAERQLPLAKGLRSVYRHSWSYDAPDQHAHYVDVVLEAPAATSSEEAKRAEEAVLERAGWRPTASVAPAEVAQISRDGEALAAVATVAGEAALLRHPAEYTLDPPSTAVVMREAHARRSALFIRIEPTTKGLQSIE